MFRYFNILAVFNIYLLGKQSLFSEFKEPYSFMFERYKITFMHIPKSKMSEQKNHPI